MDFSDLGVKSRKTGLKARDNVRRDEHDMEDLDDFFREEHTTLVNESSTTKPPNGRIIFPPSNSDRILRSPTSNHRIRNSPLLSPLPSHSQRQHEQNQRATSASRGLSITNDRNSNDEDDDSEQFDDANENPPANYNDEVDDSDENMEIDDESRGNIKMVKSSNIDNDNQNDMSFDLSFTEDTEKVYPKRQDGSSRRDSSTPTTTPKRDPLFVPEDEDDRTNEVDIPNESKSFSQRQKELERNTTVRSSGRRPMSGRNTAPASTTQTPTKLKLTASLKSPKEVSKLSSKSIASLSKNLALNKKKQRAQQQRKPRTPSPKSGSASEYEYNDDSGKDVDSDENPRSRSDPSPDLSDSFSEPSMPTLGDDEYDSDSESDTIGNRSKRLGKKVQVIDEDASSEEEENEEDIDDRRGRSRNRKGGNGRVNKFKRGPSNGAASPSKEHVIDVKRLKKEQESRSASRKPQEQQPTRRSSRVRIPPLAFWRNERAVYEKGRGDKVPTLKKIITVDEKPEPIRSRMPSRASSTRRTPNNNNNNSSRPNSRRPSKSRANSFKTSSAFNDVEEAAEEEEDEEEDQEEQAVENGEFRGSEWLKNGFLKIDTFEGHGSDVKNDRLVAWAPGTENFSSSVVSATDNFKLAILFDKNRDFIATGMMLIPPGGVKSLKSTDTTYFVFYCISGIVEVTLSGSVFLIKKGCSLEVPMGNFYQFVNKGKKDATLFFVQTRGQVNDDDDWDGE